MKHKYLIHYIREIKSIKGMKKKSPDEIRIEAIQPQSKEEEKGKAHLLTLLQNETLCSEADYKVNDDLLSAIEIDKELWGPTSYAINDMAIEFLKTYNLMP